MNDSINAAFELASGFFILLSIIQLHKDKMSRGISVKHIVLFWLWGVWNVYYYPSLDQWWSFVGGCFLLLTNTIWTLQTIYYIRREKLND